MQPTVLTGPERRRRWTTAEKLRIVEESQAPGVVANDVARRYDIHPHQLHRWRQQWRGGRLSGGLGPKRASGSEARFVPVAVSAAANGATAPTHAAVATEPTPIGSPAAGTIEMEFANGSRMRVTGAVESALLAAALAVMVSNGGQR
jgi:transposase